MGEPPARGICISDHGRTTGAIRVLIKILWSSLCLFLSACVSLPSPAERRITADALASRQGWQPVLLPTGRFDLIAYLPISLRPADHLTVYIEGDGLAWVSETQPSLDPTPLDPLALRLALAQPEGNAAYLARPCQYADAEPSACSRRYWTEMRFAPEVIEASDRAIDALKQKFGARRLTLVGYSGGAAVALLVAARRHDVTALVTVAGNLDHRAWTQYHSLPPLTGSLNPADAGEDLSHVRQRHLAGGKDTTVPPGLIESFAHRFPAEMQPAVHLEPTFDHHCCWAENWQRLWRMMQGQ